MTELSASWNGVSSTTLTGLHLVKTHRGMIGASRDQFVPTPGREGAWGFSELRGNRRIVTECAIGAGSVGVAGRHALVVAVADWFDIPGPNKLIFSDQTDRYWLGFAAGSPDPDEWREGATFSLEWECAPYAYDVNVTTTCASALSPSGWSSSIVNPGNVDLLPEITITPLNGGVTALTSFSITVNGDTIASTATVAAGTPINLSSLSDTVTTGLSTDTELLGAYDPANLVMQTVLGDFPILSPGSNAWNISWSGGATVVRVCFRYRRRYR